GYGNIVVVEVGPIGEHGIGYGPVGKMGEERSEAIDSARMPMARLVVKGDVEESQAKVVPQGFHQFQAFFPKELSSKKGIAEFYQIRGIGNHGPCPQGYGKVRFGFQGPLGDRKSTRL